MVSRNARYRASNFPVSSISTSTQPSWLRIRSTHDADASSEPNRSHDQKQPSSGGYEPGGSRGALTSRRQTLDGDGCCHDSHRAKVHDPNDQQDGYQTGTTLAAME